MIVISDTSCLTNLLAIHREELLRTLFNEVIVPHAVILELEEMHSNIPGFVVEKFVKNTPAVEQLETILDQGEAEAIILGEELQADYLLIDETDGRRIARQRGLKVIGLLGVLKLAKDKGFISEIKPLINALQTDAGFWISPELRQRVLADSKEL